MSFWSIVGLGFSHKHRPWLGDVRIVSRIGWSWGSTNFGILLSCALLASCSSSSPPPFELLGVEPSTVRAGVETQAVIKGRNFYNATTVNLDDNAPSSIERGWDVSVDRVNIRRGQTRRIDDTSLAVVIPADLPLGLHDVSVTDPRGLSQTLSNALSVVADSITATGGASSIGSGGAGSPDAGSNSANTLSTSGGTQASGGIAGVGGTDTTLMSAGGTNAPGGTTSVTSGGTASSTGGVTATGGDTSVAGSGTTSSTFGGTASTGGTLSTGQAGASSGTCNDGIKNGSETAVDCGGVGCPACPCQQADFSPPAAIDLSDWADIPANSPLWSPSLSADGLTMFFVATVGISERIYQATRTSTTSTTFANTQAVFPGVIDNRGTPALSFDGLTLYFYSDGLGGKGTRDIFTVTRPTVTSPFGIPQPISAVNTAAKDHLPFVTRDELTLYYISEALGTSDVWRAQRSSRLVAFGAGSPVTELNGSSSEARLTLTSDGSVAYFSSDRSVPSDYDVWVAIRAGNGVLSAPAPVPTLNSTTKDMDLALSRDNTEMFFVSYRGMFGTPFIYHALRQCK